MVRTTHQRITISKDAKIRNRYNQVPHLTQDINGKVTNPHLDTSNESQEVSPFPAGDHKAHINRRAQRHSKHKTEKTKKIKTSTALERSVKYFTEGLNQFHGANLALNSDVDPDTIRRVTKNNKHGSQKVSPCPPGDHKATRNRHDSTTHTNKT